MKSLLIAFTVALTLGAQAAHKSQPEIHIKGALAEHLYDVTLAFNQVKGLGPIGDCAMGTCGNHLENVSCVKDMYEGKDKQGNLIEPYVMCTIQSNDNKNIAMQIKPEELPQVSELRRALIELVGFTNQSKVANEVAVKSIDCKGEAMGHETDALNVETTFECTIVK
jgi:hypothetical protein